jgi:hypothetical protein
MTKDQFIALSRRLFASKLDKPIKKLVEIKFCTLSFLDGDKNVVIKGYRFQPYESSDYRTVKFHVMVDGKTYAEYDLSKINGAEVGVTKNMERYLPQITALLSLSDDL